MLSVDVLGLSLWYLKSSGRQYSLSPIFRFVPTTLCVWISYGLSVLYRLRKKLHHDDLKIAWPAIPEMDVPSALLSKRPNGLVLRIVFAVMDGSRLPCAECVDGGLQNAYFQGYTGNVDVTNLLVLNFMGDLIFAGINFPGSRHDNNVPSQSGLPYPFLSDTHTPLGRAILCDTAFTVDIGALNGKIIRA